MNMRDEDIVKKSNEIQKEEMDKHKWYLSEQLHRNLGSAALIDWTNLYAKKWRETFEQDLNEKIRQISMQLALEDVEPSDENIKIRLIEWLKNYSGPVYT